MISKHPRLTFGVLRTVLSYIITYTASIISFHAMRIRTVKSLVSFVLIQDLHCL